MHETAGDHVRERAAALRRELKDEVTAEVRAGIRTSARRRAVLRCGGCCAGYLVVLLGTVALAAYIVARTGLVDVPFFRGVTRDRPPIRTVTPVALESPDAVLAAKLRMASRTLHAKSLTITLSEADLTAFFRLALESTGVPARTQETAQILSHRDALEIAARLHGVGEAETTVRIVVAPTVRDGTLTAEIRDASIGALTVPRQVARLVFNALLARLPPLRLPIAGNRPAVAADRIELREGVVSIGFRVEER